MVLTPYFSSQMMPREGGVLEYRQEAISGFSCRISPARLNRCIDHPEFDLPSSEKCPFCRDSVFQETPVFPDGNRVTRGESVTFPNLYPFARWHTVTVITHDHVPATFSRSQVTDAVLAATDLLSDRQGYSSLNWNYLPSAGASLVHPHLQALCDDRPSFVPGVYLSGAEKYYRRQGRKYADCIKQWEQSSSRHLFGEEVFWYAQPVPLGEREVRAILPVSHPSEFGPYAEVFVSGLLRIIRLYRELGTHAFNMSLFFDKKPSSPSFNAFCSVISRINPNRSSTSDSAFMERIHREPVILTLPEDIGPYLKESAGRQEL